MNILIKQANSRLLGNLYLHLVSEYFYSFLHDHKLLNYVDGEYCADNYDGIVVLSSSFNLNFSDLIKSLSVNQHDVLRAALRTGYAKNASPLLTYMKSPKNLLTYINSLFWKI